MTHQLRVLADIHMAYTDMHAHIDTHPHTCMHTYTYGQKIRMSLKKLEEKND